MTQVEFKSVEIKPATPAVIEERFIVQMNRDEATLVASLLGLIASDPFKSYGLFDNLSSALEKSGSYSPAVIDNGGVHVHSLNARKGN